MGLHSCLNDHLNLKADTRSALDYPVSFIGKSTVCRNAHTKTYTTDTISVVGPVGKKNPAGPGDPDVTFEAD